MELHEIADKFAAQYGWEALLIPEMKVDFILHKGEEGKTCANVEYYDKELKDIDHILIKLERYRKLIDLNNIFTTVFVVGFKCGSIGVIKTKDFAGDVKRKKDEEEWVLEVPTSIINIVIKNGN